MANQTYWKRALEQSERALAKGALVPLSTSRITLHGPQADQFELRVLNDRLPKHHRSEGPKANPFRPWDTDLAIDCVGDHHVLILNKYPVQQGHMLLITRDWAPQVDWLTIKDWQALVSVDRDTTGLWFLNSGPLAGASQPHRHLQLLPREVNECSCPRVAWFNHLIDDQPNKDDQIEDPLTQSCVIGRRALRPDPIQEAQDLHTQYRRMADALKLGDPDASEPPLAPYNLLLTRSWMALIRRECEQAQGFSVNALGFAGYLLATEQSNQMWLQRHGAEALLRQVVPAPGGLTDDGDQSTVTV